MNNVITDRSSYWGLCPVCHRCDGYINIGKAHWYYCREHKTRWWVGTNLFSSWRDQTEEEQRHIYDELHFETFEIVKPFTPLQWIDEGDDEDGKT